MMRPGAVMVGAALALAGMGACGHHRPSRPRPPAIAIPEAPAGPADALRIDLRWNHIVVRTEAEPALEAAATIDSPSIRVFLPESPEAGQSQPRPYRVGAVPHLLQRAIAIDVDAVEAHRSEAYIIDPGLPNAVLWLHKIELGIENAATRRRLLEGYPALLTMRGKLQHTGTLSAFVSANPFADGLAFSGRASLRGLDLRELTPWLGAAVGVRAAQGSADAFMAFTCHGGRIRGAVKIVLRGVETVPTRDGFWHWLKAHTIDAIAGWFSRESERGEILATVLPIEGNLSDPAVQVWPAVLGVLYNAFVQGLSASYAGLPLERASEPQSAAAQTWRVLIEGERPRAQPRPAMGSPPVPRRLRWNRSGEIPLSLSPDGLLRPGAEAVLQRALIDRGALAPGRVTGLLDAATTSALADFQARAGLAVTGLPSYLTARALGLPVMEIFARAKR